jgi:uncharacterized membrane protein
MIQKEHFLEQHDPERKDFQIDRIILFSDAVFAIAITLLIIEIKAPDIHELGHITTQGILEQLHGLFTKFIGFIVSFFVIAIYWRSHHRIFGFVNQYSERLIWLNIFFLFTIVLMPFSSAYYSENAQFDIPFYFYCGNIMLTGITNLLLLNHVFNPKNKLVGHRPTERYLHTFKMRSIITPAIFLSGIVLCPFFPILARFCFAFTWPMFVILNRYYRYKYKDSESHPAKRIKNKKAPTE